MRLAILGANGQLGSDVAAAARRERAKYEVHALARADLDVNDSARVAATLSELRPQVVVNAAAYNQVDAAESRASEAFAVNALAVHGLATVCARLDAVLVLISTDYVFDGKRREPYREDDLPAPQNVYGASKLAGEHLARLTCAKLFMLRTSGLYGLAGARRRTGNFVEKMLALAAAGTPIRVVEDQTTAPTASADLSLALLALIHTRAYGLYHVTNAGACTWFAFAREIFRLAGLNPDLAATTSAELGAKARRPAYSVLDNAAARAAGVAALRPWQEGLADYMRARRAQVAGAR
ncbi:MAG: dTDP-4-dehydrorhamnose reductase [Deltaproteobacteria bacterium]|nr:dTDP-4-dehydrorhamnose reductase [Deltaproteobacteria bacterium]